MSLSGKPYHSPGGRLFRQRIGGPGTATTSLQVLTRTPGEKTSVWHTLTPPDESAEEKKKRKHSNQNATQYARKCATVKPEVKVRELQNRRDVRAALEPEVHAKELQDRRNVRAAVEPEVMAKQLQKRRDTRMRPRVRIF